MQRRFREIITLFGQGPLILVWPLLLYLVSFWSFLFTAALLIGLLLSYSFGALIKLFYYKPRPLPMSFETRREKIKAWSFPSIHTSNMAVVKIMWLWRAFTMIWEGRSVWIVCILLAFVLVATLAVMLSRIELKYHFPIDVLAGIIFWIIISAFAFILTKYGLILLMMLLA